jgi:hypothetical protein
VARPWQPNGRLKAQVLVDKQHFKLQRPGTQLDTYNGMNFVVHRQLLAGQAGAAGEPDPAEAVAR